MGTELEKPELDTAEEEGTDIIMLGLDGEMSSADLATGGRLIQAGFALFVNGEVETFTSKIGYPLDSWDETTWSARASIVHNITREELAKAPLAAEVDAAAHAWLLARGATEGQRTLISIGFNVGVFDHPFFRKYLPFTMSLVSRRNIDLNPLCFTLAGWDPNPSNSVRDWAGWKSSLKDYADAHLTQLGQAGQPHDAGWDAAQALIGWKWIQGSIHASKAPTRYQAAAGQDRMLAAIFGSSTLTKISEYLTEKQLRDLASAVVLSGKPAGKTLAAVDSTGEDGYAKLQQKRFDEVITRFVAQ